MRGKLGQAEEEEGKQEQQDIMDSSHKQADHPRMRDIYSPHPHTVDWDGNTLADAIVHRSCGASTLAVTLRAKRGHKWRWRKLDRS